MSVHTKTDENGEILVARSPRWPGWMTNSHLMLGQEFETVARLETPNFDPAPHYINVVNLGAGRIKSFATTIDLSNFVLTQLGGEPRTHYVSQWLRLLEDPDFGAKYKANLLRNLDDLEGLLHEDDAPLDNISSSRSILQDVLRPNVRSKDLPSLSAEALQRVMPDKELESLFVWAETHFPRQKGVLHPFLSKVFGGRPNMLMDFWHLAVEREPHLLGFERSAHYFPENSVRAKGGAVVEAKPL